MATKLIHLEYLEDFWKESKIADVTYLSILQCFNLSSGVSLLHRIGQNDWS